MRLHRHHIEMPQRPRGARGFTLWIALLASSVSLGVLAAEPSLPYTVQPGDKLIVLARDMLVKPGDWPEVARFNALPDPDVIHPGQTVKIPLRLLKFVPVTGKVVSVQGQVQAGNVPATVGQVIGEGSRIQTGKDSSAVVELPDGSRIQLLPTSVAEVVASREYSLRHPKSPGNQPWFAGIVRLSQGAVETLASNLGLRAAPLQIQTPAAVIGVRGTRFRVAQDSSIPNARAEVLEGEVRADNTVQQSGATLPKGTGAVVDPRRAEVTVVPLLPAPDLGSREPVLTPADARAWPLPRLDGAASFRLQVAADARFERVLRDRVVNATGTADLSDVPVGQWHLRLRGIDAQKLEGFDGERRLVIASTLLVTDSLLSFIRGDTWMNWSRALSNGQAVPSSNFSADISTDPGMTRLIRQTTSNSGPFNLGTLQPGKYFIRVTSQGATAESLGVSDTHMFEIPEGWGSKMIDLHSPLRRIEP